MDGPRGKPQRGRLEFLYDIIRALLPGPLTQNQLATRANLSAYSTKKYLALAENRDLVESWLEPRRNISRYSSRMSRVEEAIKQGTPIPNSYRVMYRVTPRGVRLYTTLREVKRILEEGGKGKT